METIKQIYYDKNKRIQDVINKRIPDRIPIMPSIESWILQYSKVNIPEAVKGDMDAFFGAFKKFNEDIYVDAIISLSNSHPVNFMNDFGGGFYIVNENWIQVTGGKGETMQPLDYPDLIKDPIKFFANTILPRKFNILNQPFEKNVDLIKKSFFDLAKFMKFNGELASKIENELGLPCCVKTTNYIAPDIILDYLRDFVGTSLDIKRHSSEFLAACESLYKMVLKMFLDTSSAPDDKFIFTPMHLATYLNPKSFEKFYFPFFKRYIQELAIDRGYSLYFFCEDDWTPYIEILQDLPSGGKIICVFEKGDLKKIKEKLGNKITVAGGMPHSLLKYGSKEECIIHAKKCVDDFGIDGNYIFGIDATLVSLDDAKPENLIASLETVKEYGKY